LRKAARSKGGLGVDMPMGRPFGMLPDDDGGQGAAGHRCSGLRRSAAWGGYAPFVGGKIGGRVCASLAPRFELEHGDGSRGVDTLLQ